MPKFIEPKMMYEELMAKRIASLRKQAKGLVEYTPTVEELAKGLEEGRITREQIPKRLKKFIPGVAAGTTAGALLTEQAQAQELTIDLTSMRKDLAIGKEPFGVTRPVINLEQTRKEISLQESQEEGRTIDLNAIRQTISAPSTSVETEAKPVQPWSKSVIDLPPIKWEELTEEEKKKYQIDPIQLKSLEKLAETAEQLKETPEGIPFLVDLALLAMSGGTVGKFAAMKLTQLGKPFIKDIVKKGVKTVTPTMRTRILEGLATGATYEAAKAVTGEPAEGFGVTGAPGEESLLWGAFPPGLKVAGKGLKIVGGATGKALKGVDLVLHKPFEKIAEPLKPAADWLWDNVVIQPTNIQIPGIKKSVREMFQPAVERLAQSKIMKRRMVASTFRKTEAMKSLTTDVGRSLSHEMESLLPSEQYEVLKGLRGTPIKDLKSSKAKDVLSRFEGRIKESDLNFLYENRFREELSKGLTKSIENIEGSVSERSIRSFLKYHEHKLPQKAKLSDIHDMMRTLISNPKVSDEMQTFIKDMWSAPARTPMAVADAAREASTFYLTEKLIANRGVISSIPKEGYVISKWGRFAGQYVPRDVELQLQDISKIPRIARGVYQKWFLTPWKVSKTITRPAYHMRNLISNAILNDWGGLPFYRVDVYMDALKQMRGNSPLWKKYRQMTGAGGTFVQQDIYQLGAGLEYGASTFDKLYNVFEKTVQPMAGLQSAEENLFKFAKYLHNTKEMGMKPAEAALDAMKWCFNYGEVTTQTAYLRKYGMPFATWYTKSIPLMAETAFKHPLRFGKWLAFGAALQSYAMDQVGVTDSEWDTIEKTLPNYIQKGIYLMMPWRDDKGRLNLLNLTYILPGIGDVNELWNQAEQGLQVPNPMITILGTLSSKRKFSGAPLYYEWEPPSTKWMKTMSYVWEQMSPAIVPGGTDWNLMWRAVTEQEGALSPEQALGSWFGFKMTPVDPAREARRSEAIRKIYESEINMQMKRDLQGAKSNEEQQAVLRKYQLIRESVANP